MLFKRHEFEHSEAIAASVDFVLAEPPYNISRVWIEGNSNDHVLSSAYMGTMSKLVARCYGLESTRISFAAFQLYRGAAHFRRTWKCRRGLICLILILIEEERWRNRHLKFNRFQHTTMCTDRT